MADPAPHRRFQFRLRTLLIVVTLLAVVCGYVGRQIEIVRERKSLLTLLVAEGGGYWNTATENTYSIVGAVPAYFSPGTYRVVSHGKRDQRPPAIRRWLGDDYIYVIWLPESVAAIDATRFANGFPEADVARKNRAAAATMTGQAIGPRDL